MSEARLTDRGLEHDRRWMLVDENNQFFTQREYPAMALLQTEIVEGGIKVFHKNDTSDAVIIPFNSQLNDTVRVRVWDDVCDASVLSDELNQWFSRHLQLNCRLVYMPDSSLRKVDEQYALRKDDITNFSDGYPLLMIGAESLNDLNSRMSEPLPMNRFRPNIVMQGADAYEEDRLKHFVINGVDFYGVKLCARCPIPTINQDSLEKGQEPLRTLATYRKKNNKIYFGQNILYNGETRVKTGDVIEIKERIDQPSFE